MKKHRKQYLKLLAQLDDEQFEEMQKISKALAEQGKKADDEEMFDIALDLITKNFVSNENNKLN